MQEIDFIPGEIRGVRTEDFVNLVAVSEVNLQVKLRFFDRLAVPSRPRSGEPALPWFPLRNAPTR